VRKWRLEHRSDTEVAALSKFFGKELAWPRHRDERTGPNLPFMRLLAFRMMTATETRPAGDPDADVATHRGAALNAFVSSEGNEALRNLIDRLSLL
jgi:hypothetical protein